ncbi:hypothetical protein Fcan01_28294 [Folsomia candida]|uniref:Uncharacterized protein n=1 Tax=Folsomia candida TaxID=158441 RepID=A0A226CVM8_FOLCA|nr:hypothetical protein Fcan01_28294 [Folsomia candida]
MMTVDNPVEVGEEEQVQVFNTTPEEVVFSNPLLVQMILDNLSVRDLKTCAPTNSMFHSEASNLLDKKSKINLDSRSFKDYFETLKKGGRIPTRTIVEMTIGTRRARGRDANFVAALPSDDAFQLPTLKRFRLSTDEVNEEGEEGIRTFLRRLFSISQNLESFHGCGINNGVSHMIAQLFFEELDKIPGRPETIKELLFTPDYYDVTPVFERVQDNLVGLRMLTLNIDDMNSAEAEEILQHFKKSLTKLVINLGGIFDDYNEDGRILNLPLYKAVAIGAPAVGVIIIPPSAGVVFEKLWYLEISVALMRDMILHDAHTTAARFPSLNRICFDEREEEPSDEMLDHVWDLFPEAMISRFS